MSILTFILRFLLIFFGAAAFANGVFLCVYSNLNLGVFLTIALGVFLAACGVFFKRIAAAITGGGVARAVCVAVAAVAVAELALTGFIFAFGHADSVDYKEDAVIVLGAGLRGDRVSRLLKMRLDKAVEYSRKNPGALIAVTGGQGAQEDVTEGYAMAEYLISQGVPEERIVREERATSTYENMVFTKELLDKRLGEDYRTVVVTSDFHVYRSTLCAKAAGLGRVSHIGAPISVSTVLPCCLRESLAVLKTWVYGK